MPGQVSFRFDLQETLEAFGGATFGGDGGGWEVLTSGTTSSVNTGPGSNSAGPYCATDTSSSVTANAAEIKSILGLSVVMNWDSAIDRVLRLRCCIQGSFGDGDAEGLRVQGKVAPSDDWVDIQVIRGWDYSNNYVVGDSLPVNGGPARDCVLAGGWADVDTAIDDTYTEIRLIPNIEGSDLFRHDIALYSADLINSDQVLIAPNFADDTGADQAWTENSAIPSIIVPLASGTPTPTYSASGLPDGLSFDPSDREISGTPTSVGSGTITITADNSEGNATWTVDYVTSAIPVEVPGTPSTPTLSMRTTNSLALATVAGSGGEPTTYRWRYSTNSFISNTDPMVTSIVPNVMISGLNSDSDYWIDVRAENSAGNSDYSGDLATSTLEALTVPNFADDAGATQNWTKDSEIVSIIVPTATGNPMPTYQANGLPLGISFNSNTGLITGTPIIVSIGTITIIAVNSEGSDTWTFDYVIDAVIDPVIVTTQAGPLDRALLDARALTGVDQIYALEISHSALSESIKIVGDVIEHEIETYTYLPLMFQAEIPQSKEGEIRQATIRIDNIGYELMQWVNLTQGGRDAVIRAMMVVSPEGDETESAIVWEVTMNCGVTEITNEFVIVTLTDEPVFDRPSVLLRHDPSVSPGLF